MLTCITCKQKVEDDGGEEESIQGSPNTKDSIKSLTAQVLHPLCSILACTSYILVIFAWLIEPIYAHSW